MGEEREAEMPNMVNMSNINIKNVFQDCPTLNGSSLDLVLLSKISGWIQMIVCIFGIFLIICCLFLFRNIHLHNLFNQLLLLLSVSHLLFLLSMLFSYLAKHLEYTILVQIYPTMLHPITSIALTLSIYLTMALSVHVYRIIHHPTGRHLHVLVYFLPALLLSVCFNIPKCLETTVLDTEDGDVYIDVTELRVSPAYIKWYIHWATLLVLGVFPFLVIISLGCRVLLTVRKTGVQDQNRKHATIYIILVTIFILSHSFRLALNMHEMSAVDEIGRCAYTDLGGFSVWIIFTGFLSEIALAINSAATFLFYCLLGPKIKDCVGCCCKGRNQQEVEVEMKSEIWMNTEKSCGYE